MDRGQMPDTIKSNIQRFADCLPLFNAINKQKGS